VVAREKISIVMTNDLDANYPNFTVNGLETPVKLLFFTVTNA